MLKKPEIHLCCPLHSNNGSVGSFMTLCNALNEICTLHIWAITIRHGMPALHQEVNHAFEKIGSHIEAENPLNALPAGANIFIYMAEYSIVFGQDAEKWKFIFERANSVQFSINFNIGALPQFSWLGDYLSAIYFLNSDIASLWQRKVSSTTMQITPVVVLPPPVKLDTFKLIAPLSLDKKQIVIGLVSGVAKFAPNVVSFYNELALRLPRAQFWFMPTPDFIHKNFKHHPQFFMYERNEITVASFLEAIDIYCFPSNVNSQTLQGTRALVEAMTAGRPAVCVDRLGPKDRIKQGESGYTTNRLDEMANYVVQLAENAELRCNIGKAARERAIKWKTSDWCDSILAYTRP